MIKDVTYSRVPVNLVFHRIDDDDDSAVCTWLCVSYANHGIRAPVFVHQPTGLSCSRNPSVASRYQKSGHSYGRCWTMWKEQTTNGLELLTSCNVSTCVWHNKQHQHQHQYFQFIGLQRILVLHFDIACCAIGGYFYRPGLGFRLWSLCITSHSIQSAIIDWPLGLHLADIWWVQLATSLHQPDVRRHHGQWMTLDSETQREKLVFISLPRHHSFVAFSVREDHRSWAIDFNIIAERLYW